MKQKTTTEVKFSYTVVSHWVPLKCSHTINMSLLASERLARLETSSVCCQPVFHQSHEPICITVGNRSTQSLVCCVKALLFKPVLPKSMVFEPFWNVTYINYILFN